MTKQGLIEEIYTWISGLEYWEQYIASEILEKKKIGDAEIKTAYALFLEDNDLCKKTIKREAIALKGSEASEFAVDSSFTLKEIKDIKGVNALQENQVIPVSSGLTIIYGDNGVGKSGYIRLAWRDDAGNWTWQCTKDRLITYYETFRDTATTTKTNSKDENLYKLKKSLPDAEIELEYPIGDAAQGNEGRADIVINDTILIEMKRDSSAGAVQRAKGQILQYSDIWRNRGPVILLLCDHDYSHAKISYTSTMVDLNKLERPVMTIVAEN